MLDEQKDWNRPAANWCISNLYVMGSDLDLLIAFQQLHGKCEQFYCVLSVALLAFCMGRIEWGDLFTMPLYI